MKEKTSQNRIVKKISSSPSHFINFSIVILSIVILFLSYRLLDKLRIFDSNNSGNELMQNDKIIQVEILNGCGVEGIADKFTDELRKKNFDVVHAGNYRSFNIDESIVISRTDDKKYAELLAETIGINEYAVIKQVNKNYFLDVTLIIGKDYKQFLTTNKR